MMKITKRMISLLLCIVLLFGQIPAEGMASSFAAARAAAGPLPEMDERLCVLEQEVSAEAAAAIAGEGYESGDYRYVLTAEGFAVITGCTAESAELIVPVALDGHEVIAVWKDAFGSKFANVAVHGNVMYIHPQSFADSTAILARSGSYALAWAARQGMLYQNQTNGELVEGVRDLDDLSERVTRMSGALLRVSPATARRFSIGDIAFFTDARGVADVYRVTGMRNSGPFVYLSTEAPDLSQAVVNMKLSGTVYATAEDFVAEKGVTITESVDEQNQPQINVRSVFEGVYSDSLSYPALQVELSGLKSDDKNINTKIKASVEATYSSVEKVQYSVEIINGDFVGGTLVRDSSTVLSLDGKLAPQVEIKNFDEEIGNLFKKLAKTEKPLDEENEQQLAKGVITLPFSITVMLEAKISVNAAVHLACAKQIITKIDLDGPVLCSEDPVEGGAVFSEKLITVSDAPGLGVTGVAGIRYLN